MNLIFNVRLKLGNRKSYLLHSISITDCYASVNLRLKVIGNAKRSTNLVLTSVSLTDRACFVKVNAEVFSKLAIYLVSLLGKLLGKRKNRRLNGCKCRMKVKYCSYIILFSIDNLFVICIAKNSKNASFDTERGLDNIRSISFVCFGIKVCEILL